jgi:hypothetical protein
MIANFVKCMTTGNTFRTRQNKVQIIQREKIQKAGGHTFPVPVFFASGHFNFAHHCKGNNIASI